MKPRYILCLSCAISLFGFTVAKGQASSSVDVFEEGPEMPIARMGHQFVTLPDGRVALFGGHGAGFTALASANFWVPGEAAFTSKAMQQVRSNPIFLRLNDGRFLLAGGDSDLGTPDRADSEIYDPVADTFTPSGSMVRFRSGSGGTALADGRALIAGAWWTHNDAHTYGELFDPSTGTFSEVGPFGAARSLAIVMPMADGSAVVLGGRQPEGDFAEMPVEHYNPATGEISERQPLLFEGEPGWWVQMKRNQPSFAQKMADGRYLWMAMRSEGSTTHYRLFTFDPVDGVIAALPLQAALPDSSSGALTRVLVDGVRNRAHILVEVEQGSGYPAVEVITIDTDSGAIGRSSNSYLPGYSLMGAGMQVLADGRIFITGGSADGTNFDPVRKTFLIKPVLVDSDHRFFGGAFDGYASSEVLQSEEALAASNVRYEGGAFDGSDSSSFLQPFSPVVLARFAGGPYDGHDQSAVHGARNPLDRDSDGSGLPDWWLWQHFGLLAGIVPDEDADGDGASNLHEFLAGTDPLDPACLFRIPALQRDDSGFSLSWLSVSGMYYRVLFSSNLKDGFVPIRSNIPATPPVNVFTHEHVAEEPAYFYRIEIE